VFIALNIRSLQLLISRTSVEGKINMEMK